MAIEFHCDHCGKQVRTSGENAGKRGRCPYCEQSVYIPTPSDQIEVLDLAPADESQEAERRRLEEESREVTQAIRGDKTDVPADKQSHPPETAMPVGGAPSAADVRVMVIDYARAMFKGDLGDAEQLTADIKQAPGIAEEVIAQIIGDELPPTELQDIPRPVLNGFLKQLQE